ncbi:MAG: aromatic ring-hydroxylating dioxygenase subunit alpha [Gammaproteobacteria bacterium]|nr:aromatic ring-hydroxylating dioxygenase subunit alpha [Gammaproteobacteria bacterium]
MSAFNRIPLTSLENAVLPIENASGLPNVMYNDPELFIEERDRLLGTTWAGAGFAGDLPTPGYVKPISFMGLPLVIMRDRDDVIRVFHNVCSHRGMVLINEEGPVQGSIRCPYHSWTYDLAGQLKGTPHLGGVGVHKVDSFLCEKHGMKEVSSAVWFDIVFINLDGKAKPFETFIAPVVERWQPFLGDTGYTHMRREASGEGSFTLNVACNWKLAVENYCESYHLPWVHPNLNVYSRIQDHYHIMFANEFSGQGTMVYNLADTAGTRLPVFPQWQQNRMKEAEYITVFPNVLLGIQADHTFAIVLEPVANDHTVEHLRLMYVGDEAIGPAYKGCRDATLAAWKEVFGEDVAVVEGMQRGRASPGFSGGKFSPVQDNPTHYFHQWAAQRLIASAQAMGA